MWDHRRGTGAVVTKLLDDLARTYSCITALLESKLTSHANRRKLEELRQQLEEELAQTTEKVAADE